ncbi:MAG: TetM/TetW/TetO/TetS family tetracycline resistance ribosomal protection protein [Lachnospiraceae bacterium]|nr:TetM/TetW/TetO/TetS family tetracycline resistance ribosomal protection protein [Lachnospiraceae bacterium]
MNRLTIGILAHVDAGKTTLSEALLFKSGMIRKAGRVDHKDAFLDNYSLEKERGITIFSKQAIIDLDTIRLTLLDTPGHVDFSAEMERTLRVLDAAVLVVSATDGIQPHTRTLFSLFEKVKLPVFVFINKMDLACATYTAGRDHKAAKKEWTVDDGKPYLKDAAPEITEESGSGIYRIRKKILEELIKTFGEGFLDLTDGVSGDGQRSVKPDTDGAGALTDLPAWPAEMEDIAVLDDALLESFLEGSAVVSEDITRLVRERKLFPCFFGSALKGEGIEELLNGIREYAPVPKYNTGLSGRVFKIQRDEKQNRLTFLKLTGGRLSVKDVLEPYEEKIDQIRIYNGAGYEAVREAEAGDVVALLGITKSRTGDLIGAEDEEYEASICPVLNYSVICPAGVSPNVMLSRLRELEEEDPSLQVSWEEEKKEISLSLMGQVQLEVVTNLMKERFDTDIGFREGSIIYKETILNTVEGIGHFEPLRHYAEVHLLLEPLERGSGVVIDNRCIPDTLAPSFQKAVLSILREKRFKGVLTGSEITDIRISLASGKAHIKHTEGGDFRQACYRAVRQGLMQAASILLEPWYEFVLTIPDTMTGHAFNDLEKMGALFALDTGGEGGRTRIKGRCPARTCVNYAGEVRKYTAGEGKFELRYSGYLECTNEDEVIESIGYEPERDLRNTPDSVFCAHGAGVIVPWYEVHKYMHLPSVFPQITGGEGSSGDFARDNGFTGEETGTGAWDDTGLNENSSKRNPPGRRKAPGNDLSDKRKALSNEEIEKIIERTYYGNKRSGKKQQKKQDRGYELRKQYKAAKSTQEKPEHVMVDGYNVIFAWDELKELSRINIDSARDALIDILSNYRGFKGCELTAVFDAYKIEGHKEECLDIGGIHVVYTAGAQTADGYIEQFTHKNAGNYSFTVVTSDSVERLVVSGAGSRTVSSRDFRTEVIGFCREAQRKYMEDNYP